MSSCTGCTRRSLLESLGLGLVALSGCKISLDDRPTDASLPDTGDPPVPCEDGKVCLDITRSTSGTLGGVGGWHRISVPGDLVIIVRTGETTFVVLSAVCTHERCGVRYTSGTRVSCPCHGSQFNFDGTVARGPAMDPLKVYAHTYDPATSILTITIA